MSDTLLTHELRTILRGQYRRAIGALRNDRPTPQFTLETEEMATRLVPLVARDFVKGGRRAAKQIGAKVKPLVHQRLEVQLGQKDGGAGPPGRGRSLHRGNTDRDFTGRNSTRIVLVEKAGGFAAWLFRVFFPKVAEAVKTLTLDFCEETNRTTVMLLQAARSLLRAELLEGLEQGEALAKLTQRVRNIFNTDRAYTIARTESARAVEAGGVLAAQESGVCRTIKWMAAPECCDLCQDIADKEVEIGQPFWVNPKGGPYAIVLHPPLHVNCRCTTEYVVEDKYR